MRQKHSKLIFILIASILVLTLMRLAAPSLLKHLINQKSAESIDWRWHVDDVGLSILSAGVRLTNFTLTKVPARNLKVTFEKSNLRVTWAGLFKSELHIVGKVVNPSILVIINTDIPASNPKILKKLASKKEVIRAQSPIFIDLVEIEHLEFELRDTGSKEFPPFFLRDLNLRAENIWNRPEKQEGPSNINFSGTTSGRGNLEGKIWLSAFSESPILKGEIQLSSMELSTFNPFFKKVANFNLNEGFLDLYIEFASQNLALDGYIKPLFSKLNFIDAEESRKRSFLHKAWQTSLQLVTKILKNSDSKKVATKIEFSGRLDDAKTFPWLAFVTIMRNAFEDALWSGFDRDMKIQPHFPHSTVHSAPTRNKR